MILGDTTMKLSSQFHKAKTALAVATVISATALALTGCNDDDKTVENPYNDSALISQIEQLETDLDMQEKLLEVALKQQPVGFVGIDYPITDAAKRAIQASPYAIIETNSYDIAPIGFHTILRSGEKAAETDPFVFGQLINQNGEAIFAVDGSADISVGSDFSSLLPVGDSLFMVSHFEDRPAAMYLTELNQDSATGELSALRSRPLDFSAVDGGWTHCAGSVTPWNTHLGSEEYEPDASAWDATTGSIDDYYDAIGAYFAGGLLDTHPYNYGYQVEVAVTDYDNATVTKHYSMGRVAHELAYVMPDERTAYISDDGTDVGLFMFVADAAQDLSAGTLYVAKWTQTSADGAANGGSADLTWVNLGHADDATINAVIDSGINYADIFTETEVNTDGTCPDGFTKVDHTYGQECLQFTSATYDAGGSYTTVPMEVIASRLETRRYASMMGGTTEFRKMEGITHNPDDSKLYVAMSAVSKGMEAGDRTLPPDDIRLGSNGCGVVYELDLAGSISDTGATAIDSDYVAVYMSGLVAGIPTTYDASSVYAGNTCDVNGISNPDNITFLPGRDTLIIGEDTGSGHQNDLIWSYNLTHAELTRIQTTPYGSETTSAYFYPNINGWAYLMSVVQHPYGESDQDQLSDPADARAYTGYIGPFPAM
jgi:secreted PhoX family phosphatase/outer membrane murein-binding lipoprotein Lpp